MSGAEYVVPNIFRDRTTQEDLVDRVEAIVEAEREDETPDYQASDLDVEVALHDMEDGFGFDSRQDREDARRWLISKGVYRETTRAELARTWRLVRGRERQATPDFKLDGRLYLFEENIRDQKKAGGS